MSEYVKVALGFVAFGFAGYVVERVAHLDILTFLIVLMLFMLAGYSLLILFAAKQSDRQSRDRQFARRHKVQVR